ncbi:MAG: DUF2809 domain-containing protein [Phycisphaera sp.]|nr:DUF2809 domain-containing protein [Phycisphaera sp.]
MLVAAAFGLSSRTSLVSDWPIIGPFGGDASWTMAACGGFRALLPGKGSMTLALLGFAASFLVEIFQAISIEWLDALRATRPGALLLGRGFLWSDLTAYSAGAVFAWCADRIAVVSLRP